jgi:SAM-dependent methyltransferase
LPSLIEAFRDRVVGGRPNDWQVFHELIAQHLRPGIRVLDVGCGQGDVAPFPWRAFPTVELIGIDTDAAAFANQSLRRFLPLQAGAPWPIEQESIDLVLCRYVLEHVEDPHQFFDNVRRSLKPGGLFLFLTPNLRHPIAMLSRVLPGAVKRRVLRWAKGIQEEQVFPTCYRANSPPRLARLAQRHGLETQTLFTKEFVPSGYLEFSVLGYFCAWAYFALVRRTGWEKYCGAQIIGAFQKPARAPSPACPRQLANGARRPLLRSSAARSGNPNT